MVINYISPYSQSTSGLFNKYILRDSELEKEIEQILRWKNEGFPTFSNFDEDSHIYSPIIFANFEQIRQNINDKENEIMLEREYDGKSSYNGKSNFGTTIIDFDLDKDGQRFSGVIDGPLCAGIKLREQFSIESPAIYHFEKLDTIVSIPYSFRVSIREYGEKIAEGWIEIKYNQKKNEWKVKSINEKNIPKEHLPIIAEYFQKIPEGHILRKKYQKGKHCINVGLFNHYIHIMGEDIDLNPLVIIFSNSMPRRFEGYEY